MKSFLAFAAVAATAYGISAHAQGRPSEAPDGAGSHLIVRAGSPAPSQVVDVSDEPAQARREALNGGTASRTLAPVTGVDTPLHRVAVFRSRDARTPSAQ